MIDLVKLHETDRKAFWIQAYKDSEDIKEDSAIKNKEIMDMFRKVEDTSYKLTPAEKVSQLMKHMELIVGSYGLNVETYKKAKLLYPDLLDEAAKLQLRFDAEYAARITDLYSNEGWENFVNDCAAPFVNLWVRIMKLVNKNDR